MAGKIALVCHKEGILGKLNKHLCSTVLMIISKYIYGAYIVQYASFEKFCSKTQNFQNFDLAVIFIVMHHMSSYITVNSRKTLGIDRMRCFLPFFSI